LAAAAPAASAAAPPERSSRNGVMLVSPPIVAALRVMAAGGSAGGGVRRFTRSSSAHESGLRRIHRPQALQAMNADSTAFATGLGTKRASGSGYAICGSTLIRAGQRIALAANPGAPTSTTPSLLSRCVGDREAFTAPAAIAVATAGDSPSVVVNSVASVAATGHISREHGDAVRSDAAVAEVPPPQTLCSVVGFTPPNRMTSVQGSPVPYVDAAAAWMRSSGPAVTRAAADAGNINLRPTAAGPPAGVLSAPAAMNTVSDVASSTPSNGGILAVPPPSVAITSSLAPAVAPAVVAAVAPAQVLHSSVVAASQAPDAKVDTTKVHGGGNDVLVCGGVPGPIAVMGHLGGSGASATASRNILPLKSVSLCGAIEPGRIQEQALTGGQCLVSAEMGAGAAAAAAAAAAMAVPVPLTIPASPLTGKQQHGDGCGRLPPLPTRVAFPKLLLLLPQSAIAAPAAALSMVMAAVSLWSLLRAAPATMLYPAPLLDGVAVAALAAGAGVRLVARSRASWRPTQRLLEMMIMTREVLLAILASGVILRALWTSPGADAMAAAASVAMAAPAGPVLFLAAVISAVTLAAAASVMFAVGPSVAVAAAAAAAAFPSADCGAPTAEIGAPGCEHLTSSIDSTVGRAVSRDMFGESEQH
ncbi:hypothetical protein Vretifemale_8549, partial [Volvox reticuliferus]